jgi:hypothetical protein
VGRSTRGCKSEINGRLTLTKHESAIGYPLAPSAATAAEAICFESRSFLPSAKDLQQLIGRRRFLMIEVVDAFLPSDNGKIVFNRSGH